jgi:hypothetical protein
MQILTRRGFVPPAAPRVHLPWLHSTAIHDRPCKAKDTDLARCSRRNLDSHGVPRRVEL